MLDPVNEWVEEVDGCLLWMSTLDSGGYSKTSHQVNNVRQHVSAHVLVCEEFHGVKEHDSDMVEHLCEKNGDRNHRRCIKPEHLKWGSYRDNNREWKTRKAISELTEQRDVTVKDFNGLFVTAQEIIIGLGAWADIDEGLVDSALQELQDYWCEGGE